MVMKSQKISVQCCCLVVSDSCNLMDWHEVAMRQPGSLPGSSVHGISQSRILEWVAIFFSRESWSPKDSTCVSCIAGGFFTIESPGTPSFQRLLQNIPLWAEAPGRQVYWQALHSSSITTFNSKLSGFRTKGLYRSFVNFMH